MLFYSYAELVIGLVAVFYFTSKIFSIIKYKIYFCPVFNFYNINRFVCLLYKKRPTVCNSAGFAFLFALIFLPISLGYNKKMMLLFSSLFFSGLTFFISEIYQLLCSIYSTEFASSTSVFLI